MPGGGGGTEKLSETRRSCHEGKELKKVAENGTPKISRRNNLQLRRRYPQILEVAS